ncbi:hypothetical protein [Micromonospora sp. NBC_00421]|uniref:hypothetical protein n=1 Tax=Micromonospora sp. NBC_00421 TaxID=2975976 RepID=UPI002E249B31
MAAKAVVPPPLHPGATRDVVRTRTGTTVLDAATPTVTLTRLQSGIGALVIGMLRPDGVGDLRLGCAYQLRTGQSSTVQNAGDQALVAGNPAVPVIVKGAGRDEQLSLDLRRCRDIDRLIVYAFSERDIELCWGGVLVVSTFGGARIELPLDAEPSRGVRVVLSLYRVGGEFVLRNEMETIDGQVRDACLAYGFDRITWIDGRTTTNQQPSVR